jgi:acyl-CoA synthetase (AMP-forming)/AMP-acid ligase II
MIIRSGMNIYPQEIENALFQDKRVKDILAYGITENCITQIGLKIKESLTM